jgi:hypothetical protein
MAEIFISYSSRHPVYADFLQEDLELSGFECWRDKDRLKGGDLWKGKIEKALQQAVVVVVIVTADAIRSEWVRYEVSYANSLRIPCIPVVMQRVNLQNGLMKLGLETRQIINFVTKGRKVGFAELTTQLRKLTDEWQPLADTIPKLQYYSTHVRLNAIQVLGASGDFRVLPYLLRALSEEDNPKLVEKIIEVLSNFKSDLVISTLVNIIDDVETASINHFWIGYTTKAIQSLGRFTTERPLLREYILTVLDQRPTYWSAVIQALNMSHEEGKEFVFQRMLANINHEHLETRYFAHAMLFGEFNDRRALEPLKMQVVLETDESIKESMSRQIERLEKALNSKGS